MRVTMSPVNLSSYSHQCLLFCLGTDLVLRDPWRYIKYGFLSRFASKSVRDQIADSQGKFWSAFDAMPGWLPNTSSPIEWMHMVYLCRQHVFTHIYICTDLHLGLTRHVIRVILLGGGMFNGKGRNYRGRRDWFEAMLDAVWWPGSVSRPPKKVMF